MSRRFVDNTKQVGNAAAVRSLRLSTPIGGYVAMVVLVITSKRSLNISPVLRWRAKGGALTRSATTKATFADAMAIRRFHHKPS